MSRNFLVPEPIYKRLLVALRWVEQQMRRGSSQRRRKGAVAGGGTSSPEIIEVVPVSQPLSAGTINVKTTGGTVSAIDALSAISAYLFADRHGSLDLDLLGNSYGLTVLGQFTGTSASLSAATPMSMRLKKYPTGAEEFVIVEPVFFEGAED